MSGVITVSNETLNEGAGASIKLSGGYDTITAGSGSSVSLLSGFDDTVNMSNGTVALLTSSIEGFLINGSNNTASTSTSDQIDVVGNNNTITAGSSNYVPVSGSGNTISAGSGSYVLLGRDGNDDINMSNGSMLIWSDQSGIYLNGSDDTITVDSNDNVTCWDSGNTVTVSGGNDDINMSNGSIVIASGQSGFYLAGSNDTIAAGSNDTINASSGGSVSLSSGFDDTVNVSNGTVALLMSGMEGFLLNGSNNTASTSTSDQIDVVGNNNTITAGSSNYVPVSGSGNTISAGSGSYVLLGRDGNDDINMSNSSMLIWSDQSGIYLNGSDDTITVDSNDNITCWDSGNTVTVSGSNDDINMSNGSISIASGQSGIYVNGSNDTITADASDTIILWDNSNTVNLSGSSDDISMNSGSILIGSGQSGFYLNGSNDTIAAGASDTIICWNSDNTVNLSGSYDTVNMSNGTVALLMSGMEGFLLNGSNNTASTSTSDQIDVVGNNNTITAGSSNYVPVSGSGNTISAGSGSYVLLGRDGNDDINMSNSSMLIWSDQSGIYLNGSDDTITVDSNDNVTCWDSGNTVTVSGGNDDINMSSGSISMGSGQSGFYLNGSNDTITAGANDTITCWDTGNTVTLNAGDSGDTIDMIGGTVVLGANLTNITINGVDDQLSGPGAALAGVIHNEDIPLLVNYFEANPNLSQDQIQALESDSNYETNLATYLNTANISEMPANVLAMLDGYSSLYLALLGVPASALKEEAEIEQGFAWGISQVPGMVSDGMTTMLQNLFPTLLDTNTTTELEVSEALWCLQSSEASPNNRANIIFTDVAAKLLLEMAEQPDNAKTSTLTEAYQLNPGEGLSGPYALTVQPNVPTSNYGDAGSSDLIYIKNEGGLTWSGVWSDLDNFVTPLIDIAALIPEPLQPAFQAAAAVIEVTQGGQEFAAGDDFSGVLSVLGAVAGGLTQAQSIISPNLAELGAELSKVVAAAQSIDGVVVGAEDEQVLTAIASAFGGISSVTTGNQSLQDLQVFSAIGSGLAAAAVAETGGNILPALAALMTAASDPAVQAAYTGFDQASQAVFDSFMQNWVDPIGGESSSTVVDVANYLSSSYQEPSHEKDDMELFTGAAEGEYLTGYVPGPGSGITVGEGIDLGNLVHPGAQGYQDLINMGVPAAVAYDIPESYFGLRGQDALNKLGQVGYSPAGYNNHFQLSQSDVDQLNTAVQNFILTQVQNEYTNDNPVMPWNKVPVDTQIAMAYVVFHNGPSYYYNSFWTDVVSGNFVQAANFLENSGQLVNKEAGNLIMQDATNPKSPALLGGLY